ncbi:MAG: long-chain fatty acid--CoA ligase [Spirochaetales bacterium]|nr:long-chain fatty acid--CoA ligase [Spirochaetales bacterium]
MKDTIPKLLVETASDYPEHVAQLSKDENGEFRPTTFSGLLVEVCSFAAGLKKLGISRNDHLGLISENRKEWLIADLAVMCIGAIDVPRGCDSTADELKFILDFSDCKTCFVENTTQMEKILTRRSSIPALRRFIVLDNGYKAGNIENTSGLEVLNFSEVMETGRAQYAANPQEILNEIEKGNENDTVTIIFTSGTTGEPKGVMLSHRNFLHQVKHVPDLITAGPGDRWLSVLPVWHSFERIMQYVTIGSASALAYSKPIGKVIVADMAKVKPTWMASVPRIWEALRNGIYQNVNSEGGIKKALFLFFVAVGKAHSNASNLVRGLVPQFKKRSRVLDFLAGILPFILLYPLRALGNVLVFSKIKHRLGGSFVAGISGGGGLPSAVDGFFQAAGVLLIEGYGMTETAPVLSLRLQKRPVPGTIGPIFPGTEFKIVDENMKELGPGEQGVLIVRGPQVMSGYYKRPDLTAAIMDKDGWLNTGDLAMKTHKGEIKIVGRAKDTIVLMGGENVEPAPIEEILKESRYISTSVVLGQDKKFLAALIVVNLDNLKAFAQENGVPYESESDLVETREVQELFRSEINNLVSAKNGFKSFERINRFHLLSKEFEVGRELSAKQEIKRHEIDKIYARQIEKLFL